MPVFSSNRYTRRRFVFTVTCAELTVIPFIDLVCFLGVLGHLDMWDTSRGFRGAWDVLETK